MRVRVESCTNAKLDRDVALKVLPEAFTSEDVVRKRGGGGARLTHVGLVSLLLILGVCGASAEVMRWQVDGEKREAIVYAPAASQGAGRVPLVLSFHGYGDNMQNFQHTDVHLAWPDAIVVYLQGLETRGGLPGWQVWRGDDVNRDLRLVDVALASLRETYNVDDDRIYARPASRTVGCSPTCSGRSDPACSPPTPRWQAASVPRGGPRSRGRSFMWLGSAIGS